MNEPIETEVVPTQALTVRDTGGALSYALGIEELHRNLEFVRQVMRQEMREGQDFGKIPGTGDKPTLLQPGAQKLLLTFNLTETVKKETLREYPNFHREYAFTVTVKAQNGKEWDGIGTCSTLETKYRYRKAERKCPKCGKHTIIKGKEEYGGGWLCFGKKGGCGAKFEHNDPAITDQQVGRVEHDNPPDYWNTVQKMAFKRALVHAAINATNTSDLWTQDLEPEDDGQGESEPPPKAPAASKASPRTSSGKQAAPPERRPNQNGSKGQPDKSATDSTRTWMIGQLHANPGMEARKIVSEFFTKVDALLPGSEQLEDLPLHYVPTTKQELASLSGAIAAFEAGEPAAMPYRHPMQPSAPKDKPKPIEVPRDQDAGQQEEAERAIRPDWQVVTGKVERVSVKTGTKKNGEEWTLYGIKIGDDWFNSFSSRIGRFAQAVEKDEGNVELFYSEDSEGRFTAEEIR